MKKNVILIFIIVAAVTAITCGIVFGLLPKKQAERPFDANVTISVYCKNVVKKYDDLDPSLKDEKYVPKSGVIVNSFTCGIYKGDSVYDALTRALSKDNLNIAIDKSTSVGGVYIKGINHIYEDSVSGVAGGWMFSVNGAYIMKPCDKVEIQDGDVIEWHYTCDSGKDLGIKV